MQLTIRFKDIKLRYYMLAMMLLHVIMLFKHIESTPFSAKEDIFKEQPIKIQLLPTPKSDSVPKQVVETQESNLKTNANAEFLGKKDNTVDRQTVSKTVASFKNAGLGSSEVNGQNSKSKKESAKTSVKRKLSFSDLAIGTAKMQESMLAERGIKNGDTRHKGVGQSNDFIKDIPLGDFTKLNTQEYEFYGFYHRIRQKLEQFWGRNIQEQAEKMYKSGRSLASEKNHLTSLTITLNEKGEIVSVNINATSGVKELDQAAVKSFNEAGPFPNPPKKMLKGGVAKIEWGFVVNT